MRILLLPDTIPCGHGQKWHRVNAFSLIEVLVAMGIIGVLSVLLFGAVTQMRTSANLAKSINILKQLQTANFSYAGDHDGSFLPVVTFNANGVDRPWQDNEEFRRYLGVMPPNAPWPDNLISPGAQLRDAAGNRRIERSYGMNNEDLITGNWGDSKSTQFGTRVVKVASPARTIAFADALDWMINSKGVSNYRGKEEDLKNQGQPYSVAYRYRGKAGFVFFDGHAEALSMKELQNNTNYFKYTK